MAGERLFLRAVLAFLALPGAVAFAIPWLLFPHSHAFDPLGLSTLLPGTVLLLWCVAEFYREGKGTLAPWSPPKRLVTSGPYRFSRNPMYVGVILILFGWALAFHERDLWIYAVVVMSFFHVRVLLAEERWAKRTFQAEWEAYKTRVPRWLF